MSRAASSQARGAVSVEEGTVGLAGEVAAMQAGDLTGEAYRALLD